MNYSSQFFFVFRTLYAQRDIRDMYTCRNICLPSAIIINCLIAMDDDVYLRRFSQMIMTAVAALIVDRAGRKPLLIFSSSVMLISLVALGLYFNLKTNGSDISNLGWLPLTSLTLYMISFSIGWVNIAIKLIAFGSFNSGWHVFSALSQQIVHLRYKLW